ncbi:MAG: hypothetical protein N2C14_16235, partial [Planctomycetales bacterium]
MKRKQDQLAKLAQSAPPAQPPADLLERCLSTVPPDGVSPEAERWLQEDSLPQTHNGNSAMQRGQHTMETNGRPTVPFSNQGVPAPAWVGVSAAACAALALTIWFFQAGDSPTPDGPMAEAVVEESNPETDRPTLDHAPLPNAVAEHNAPTTVVQDAVAPAPKESVEPAGTQGVQVALLPALPAEVSDEELLQEQLAAGEFAPALRSAKKLKSIETRDEWLARIGVAQAQSGDVTASWDTLGQTNNDATRAASLRALANGSIGGPPTRGGPAPILNTPVGGGGAGGAAQADFDQLIDLITSTVSPNSWDTVGGPGSVQPFATGVYVDAQGMLHRRLKVDNSQWLVDLRRREQREHGLVHGETRRPSRLRKVSLTRLEKYAQMRAAAGLPLDESMAYLAGLEKIEYVMIYPDSRDLVIAGPAAGWMTNGEGQVVSTESGRPVLRLE